MKNSLIEEQVRSKFISLRPLMNEYLRRRWAAVEATTIGYGGISIVARATGLSRNTIVKGIAEVSENTDEIPLSSLSRIRRAGGGRKRLTEREPELLKDLEALVAPLTRGEPESPLRWTCKSTRKLSEALQNQGHEVKERTVAGLLKQLGYSLQSNRKTKEGSNHPDRDTQFEFINTQVQAFQNRSQPVISVDTKKKELVGDFLNKGQEWQPKGIPEEVNVYDFINKELGKAIPYGVYDVTLNKGWVSVGIDHDTARFATETLRRWWEVMGHPMYPNARELLITADGGGSNSSRSRLWKVALQELADDTGLEISVCHFPPGTSKWNKIEHRMFCHITENWRGRPLRSLEIIVNLIGNTTTKTGLRIQAELNTGSYETGIKVSDEELAAVRIKRATFHGEWNYTIMPTC
jgi:transposase